MRLMNVACTLVLATALTGVVDGRQMQVFPAGGDGPMQMPAPGRELKTGTGRIKGRLLTADTGAPVRRAQVRLSGTDVMPKIATTDNEGAYEFRDLPAGRFTVTATKSGFVSVGYGQTRPFESGKPIDLAEGQVLDRADITMPKGSVIAGRILDEFGEPLTDASVSALRSTWSNGRRRLQATGRTALTNDLGQYRIYGLPPGEYYVSATLRGGGVQEMMVMEMEAVAAVRTGLAAAGSGGEPPRSGYAPTYYPGTPNGAEAQRLSVALGQEAQNTDFALVPVRLARISGTVIGSDGRPLAGVMVNAVPRSSSVTNVLFPSGGTSRTDQSGNFTLNGVAPGEYTLNAQGAQTITSSEGGRTMVFTMRTMAGGGDGGSEFGSIPLSVAGDDLANVVIATSKGTSASGKVTYEGGSAPSRNTLRISAASPDAEGPMMLIGASSSVTAEGTFEIRGLAGPRLFRVTNMPAGWVLKAIRHNGTDITDEEVDVNPAQPITGLEVVLTTRTTEVSGTVKAGNDPATDYTVVIFSDDPAKWAVPMTRHIASARPSQTGRFEIKNLPAGSYYAVALEYIPQGDWNDPEVLDRLRTRAERFSLDEGEVKTLDLRLDSM
jgi:hypothetical protein